MKTYLPKPDRLLVGACVELSLPNSDIVWERALFDFAQYLRAIPRFDMLPPGDRKKVIRRYWYMKVRQQIDLPAFEIIWFDFEYAYKAIRHSKNPLLPAIVMKAKGNSCDYPELFLYDKQTQLMIKFFYHFQEFKGKEPFYISCRKIQQLLSINKNKIAEVIKELCKDNVIAVVREHTNTESRYFKFIKKGKRMKSEKSERYSRLFWEAFSAAKKSKARPKYLEYRDPNVRKVIRFCWKMSRIVGDYPFPLSNRFVQEITDYNSKASGKVISQLIREGIIELEEEGVGPYPNLYWYVGPQE